jgi:hypothetical protein
MKNHHDRTEDLENTATFSSGNVYADLGYENLIGISAMPKPYSYE